MGTIRRYITNTFPRISYPHSEYEEIRNRQILDQSTRDIDVSVDSNNKAISAESMNVAQN